MEVVYDSLLLSNPYFTSEIHNGEFSIEADAGEFKLMIGAPGYKMMSTAELINQESVVLSCGDSLYFEVELEKENWHKDRIYFSTYPTDEDLKLGVNSTWTFDVDAECDDDQIAIRYKLEEAPEGMTINELTGELSWLPTESGMYYFAVIAYDANGTENMAVMSFTLNVFTCATPITVSGTVVYDNPDGASELEPVEFGYAVLMSADVLDSANVGHKPYYSNYAEITNGEYSLQADAGSYYLWFTSYGAFEEEFWENAYDFDNATIIELECGNSYTFDASVAKYTMPEYKTISGRVTDEETGAGIGQALVAFEGSNDKNQKIHLIVLTDSDGYYVAELDDNFEYIAQASTTCWRPGGNHQDTLNLYIPEYYNDVTNISEAEVLTLEEDLENIDFALAKSFDFENSLSGSVVDGDNNVVSPAWVVAFLVDTDKDNQDHINWGFTTEADQNGAFSFESILPGNYVLLAFPEDIDLAPGYFVENDFASIDWKEATKVAVSEDGTIAGKTIKLQKMEDVKGIGIIRGKIAKKGKKGIGMVEGDAEPISGALVYTIDEAGKIVEFKRTNTLGDFAIENLPNGRYNIVVDKVGFDGLSMWAEIDDNNKELDVNTMTLNESTTSIEDKIFAELSLYPNPAVTTLTVNLGTLNSDAKVQLVDVNGVSLYKGTVKSNENHKIDVNALTSGMYYLKVTIADELTVLPVAITK
jgi:hypothetical protein